MIAEWLLGKGSTTAYGTVMIVANIIAAPLTFHLVPLWDERIL